MSEAPHPQSVETLGSDIAEVARSRHTTKAYAPEELSDDEISGLLDLLRYSASSVNIQPWHFIVATTPEGRDKVAKVAADEKYSFNSESMRKAGMVVIFAARREVGDNYLDHLLASEDEDGRYPTPENKAEMKEIRKWFVDISRDESGSASDWMARQVYWNGGQFLLGAAAMGLDATPMEGIDTDGLDAAFDLGAKGYGSLFAVTVGRNRDADDWNFNLPKSRLPIAETMTRL